MNRQALATAIGIRDAAQAVFDACTASHQKAITLCVKLSNAIADTEAVASNRLADAASDLAAQLKGNAPAVIETSMAASDNTAELKNALTVATEAKASLAAEVAAAQAILDAENEAVKQATFAVLREEGDKVAAEIMALHERLSAKLDKLRGLEIAAYIYTVGVKRPDFLSSNAIVAMNPPAEKQYLPGQDPAHVERDHWRSLQAKLMTDASAAL